MGEEVQNTIFQYLNDMSILYVEDDENTKKMVEFFLEKKVKRLYSGINGEEGLSLFKQHKPDLIITDINMPLMSGIEMSKRIRELR